MKDAIKKIGVHLIIMLAIVVAIVIATLYSLDNITRHGEKQIVPELVGNRIDQALEIIDAENLEYVIQDSVYSEEHPKMTIIDQNPKAGREVKEGRKIYLTINSLDVPMVEMPDLAGKSSLKQAKNRLAVSGLTMGQVIKEADPSVKTSYDEPVLEQRFGGKPVLAGTKLKKKSVIDLVVGVMPAMLDSFYLGNEDSLQNHLPEHNP